MFWDWHVIEENGLHFHNERLFSSGHRGWTGGIGTRTGSSLINKINYSMAIHQEDSLTGRS